MMCKRLSLRILSLGVLIQCCLLCNGEAVHLYSSCRGKLFSLLFLVFLVH